MRNKKMLVLALTIALASTAAPMTMVKANEVKPEAISSVISAPVTPIKGITTNKLKPYVLNEKEVNTIFMNSIEEIDKLKLNAGYYVFDNEKYNLERSEVYVLISLGERRTTGYGVKISSVEDIEGISNITIQEVKPSPDMMVGEAITYPYAIVKFAQGTPNVRVVTDSGIKLSSLGKPVESKESLWMVKLRDFISKIYKYYLDNNK